jgi:hypothetical protein
VVEKANLMAAILAIATVLGGLAALWFFWDKIIAWLRPQPRSSTERDSLAGVDPDRVALELKLAQLARFTWTGRVLNHAPEQQFVEVEANDDIEVLRLTYCTEKNAGIATDEVQPPIKVRQVRIPIRPDCLIEVQRVGYNPHDGSFNMKLKIGARVLGEYRELVHPTHVRQTAVGSTAYRDVFG